MASLRFWILMASPSGLVDFGCNLVLRLATARASGFVGLIPVQPTCIDSEPLWPEVSVLLSPKLRWNVEGDSQRLRSFRMESSWGFMGVWKCLAETYNLYTLMYPDSLRTRFSGFHVYLVGAPGPPQRSLGMNPLQNNQEPEKGPL